MQGRGGRDDGPQGGPKHVVLQHAKEINTVVLTKIIITLLLYHTTGMTHLKVYNLVKFYSQAINKIKDEVGTFEI